MKTALIILGAGKGTRMNSDLPKVLHPLGAAPLLYHALQAGFSLEPSRVVVVTGHGAEAVRKSALAYDAAIETVEQIDQLGTAHAVCQTADLLAKAKGDAIVLYGDTPFVRPETLEAMLAARAQHAVVVLGFEAATPGGYGRLVTEGDNGLVGSTQLCETYSQLKTLLPARIWQSISDIVQDQCN